MLLLTSIVGDKMMPRRVFGTRLYSSSVIDAASYSLFFGHERNVPSKVGLVFFRILVSETFQYFPKKKKTSETKIVIREESLQTLRRSRTLGPLCNLLGTTAPTEERCGSPVITDTAEEESKKSGSEAGVGMAVSMPQSQRTIES